MVGLEILLFFMGVSSVVAIPLAVLLGLPLLAWNLRAFIRLKEREIDLKCLQTAAVIRRTHGGMLPQFVDSQDADAVLAWMQTEAELATINH